MSELELSESISQALKQVLHNPNLKVSPSSLLIGDLGLESIDFLDLTSELENTIGLEVDFKEVVLFTKAMDESKKDLKSLSVENLTQYILNKKV